VLNLRYDPVAREGLVRLRQGRGVRRRQLSEQATGEYDRSGRLLTISISDLDATAAEFLRTGDEETLLRVIERQAGATKAGTRARPPAPRAARQRAGAAEAGPKAKPRPRARPKPAAKPEQAAEPSGEAGAVPPRRRRRRSRKPPPAEA
jgi:hypothetical protein